MDVGRRFVVTQPHESLGKNLRAFRKRIKNVSGALSHSNMLLVLGTAISEAWSRDKKSFFRISHELHLQFRARAIWIYLLLLFTLFFFRENYIATIFFLSMLIVHFSNARGKLLYIDIRRVYRHKEITRRRSTAA